LVVGCSAVALVLQKEKDVVNAFSIRRKPQNGNDVFALEN